MRNAGWEPQGAETGTTSVAPRSARERLALRRERQPRCSALRRRRLADTGLPHPTTTMVLQKRRILQLERDLLYAMQEMHRDPLTGLLNRRGLAQAFEHFGRRRSPHGGGLCCVYLDLDDFKQVNDRLGHATGDACLQHFAHVLMATLRREDVMARVGGDEFVILLPQVSGHEAAGLVYRVKETLLRRPAQGVIRLEFCAGLTEVGPGESLALALALARADRALLETKDGPKNRMIFSGSLAHAEAAPPLERMR